MQYTCKQATSCVARSELLAWVELTIERWVTIKISKNKSEERNAISSFLDRKKQSGEKHHWILYLTCIISNITVVQGIHLSMIPPFAHSPLNKKKSKRITTSLSLLQTSEKWNVIIIPLFSLQAYCSSSIKIRKHP